MHFEQKLKIQAWLDGELSDADAATVQSIITADPEAQSLAQELRIAKTMVQGNELERALPESVDFHWSKIRREIGRAETAANSAPAAASTHPLAWMLSWRGLLVPLSATAIIALISLRPSPIAPEPVMEANLSELIEVESLSQHINSICYQSKADKMFVVYLYSKASPAVQEAELDTDFYPEDNIYLQ